MVQRTEPRRPYRPLPAGQAGFPCPSGGEVSREQPRLVGVPDHQLQVPSHSSVPGETHQQQWCPLEERLGLLEAEVTDLRKQVLWGQGWGRTGSVYCEEEGGLEFGGSEDIKIEGFVVVVCFV